MNMKKELHKAAANNQRLTIKLSNGELITGVAEVCSDPERTKVRTSEGPVWVPYEDIENIERIYQMLN